MHCIYLLASALEVFNVVLYITLHFTYLYTFLQAISVESHISVKSVVVVIDAVVGGVA